MSGCGLLVRALEWWPEGSGNSLAGHNKGKWIADDLEAFRQAPGSQAMKLDDLKARLRSSAKAFRENTVYDSEGDPLADRSSR